MKKITLFLIALVLAFPAFAQDHFTDVPACTEDELIDMVQLLVDSGFLNDYMSALGLLDNPGISYGESGVYLIDEVQVQWWTEIVPEFPRCTFAVDFTLVMGRYLDEVLISTLMKHHSEIVAANGQVSAADRMLTAFEGHSIQFDAVGNATTAIIGALYDEFGISRP